MGLATGSQDWVVALKQAEHTLVPKAADIGGTEAVGGKESCSGQVCLLSHSWLSCLSSDTPSSVLPQGLCTGGSLSPCLAPSGVLF